MRGDLTRYEEIPGDASRCDMIGGVMMTHARYEEIRADRARFGEISGDFIRFEEV